MTLMDEANTALLRALIGASGLSARRFAMDVMGRDERTIRRWLAGETMPEGVASWLARLESVSVGPRTGRLTLTLGPEPKP